MTKEPRDPALYHRVRQFYARQMHHLDESRVSEWARTFTEDGVFDANGHPEPQVGRAIIEEGARVVGDQLTARRVQRRHWLGMVHVDQHDDDTIRATSYALILETPAGGATAVLMSTTCVDDIVEIDGELLVRRRTVRRDDIRP